MFPILYSVEISVLAMRRIKSIWIIILVQPSYNSSTHDIQGFTTIIKESY
jgi:hypothetical protein